MGSLYKYILATCLILFSLFSLTTTSDSDDVSNRFDCHPENIATQQACVERGCVWSPVQSEGPPPCFYNTSSFGYKAVEEVQTPEGMRLQLNITIPEGSKHPYADYVFKGATVDVEMQTDNRLRIKFYDRKIERYEVPVGKKFKKAIKKASETNYEFKYTSDSYFQVSAKRNDKMVKIWDTSVGSLMLSEQFLQLSTKLSSNNLYGFGEKTRGTFKQNFNWQKIGMYSRDQFPYPNVNLYGVHPFYMVVEEGGDAHGVLLLNSNAMEVEFQPTSAVTYRSIGGILDFYFFFGPTPENVVQQYTELIGRPMMPSYWALGFQLCRWGYNSLAKVKRTIERMKKYDIPQDVQYGDIDYMHRQLDFVIKNKTYAGLGDYVREIKEDGIKYITILDPAISYEETPGTYEPLDLGEKLGIWIKNGTGGHPIVGKVWPDKENVTKDPSWSFEDEVKYLRAEAVFPDFFHENITSWWNVLIKKFHKTLPFDGLWIDMNEVASFVAGSVHGCQGNKYDHPPFLPKIVSNLLDKTLCMSAIHQDGELEYNYHSLYGWKQSEITRQALSETTNKRGIVISRSTYVSSGKYAGHWLGDNKSEWPDMHWSIIGMMDMSLFGIPYSGADICGFFQDAKYNLCLRWMQLGAFYPFSRNHNGFGNKAQDPANYDEKFANISRSVLHIRYTLLPYLYTLFYHAHIDGGTVVRPLFHEFPRDKATLEIDRQFLWGPALLVTPVLEENTTSVEAYLPNDTWYEWYTLGEASNVGTKHMMDVPLNQIGLHLRGGHVIPTQHPANSTMYSRKNPFGLLVILNEKMEASGSLFWDDGDSLDSVAQKKYIELHFIATKNKLMSTVKVNGYSPEQQLHFNKITILGLKANPIEHLKINGVSNDDASFASDVLKIDNLKLPINESHVITWSVGNNNSACVVSNNLMLYVSVCLLFFVLNW